MCSIFSKLHYVQILIFYEIVWDVGQTEVFGSLEKERKAGD